MKRGSDWGRKLANLTLLIAAGQFLFAGAAEAAIPKTEKDALIALYQATGGNSSWKINTNWNNVKSNACLWHGVTCDELDGQDHVIKLDLGANGLNGRLPPEIGNLVMLRELDLHANDLQGPIPAEIGNLVNLEVLQLQDNALEGPLPDGLSQLTNLRSVFLSANRLTGSIDLAFTQAMANKLFLNGLDLRYNGFYSSDPVLLQSLNSKQIGGDIMATQTVDATITRADAGENYLRIFWTPVAYRQQGGYLIKVYDEEGSLVESARIEGQSTGTWVEGKESDTATVIGLDSGTFYEITVHSVTKPHADNKNEVTSDGLLAGRFRVSTKDMDTDGDGIQDNVEGKKTGQDSDGDGIPDFKDNDDDNDGFPTAVELPVSKDTDGDGTPDYLDDDDDGDGVPTKVEANPAINSDPLLKDTDNDGILDGVEIGSDPANPRDTDKDGNLDVRDPDDDGDTIPTRDESQNDFDGDKVPDYRDADDDGDGIPTKDEGPVTQDTDRDGVPDYLDNDDDNDGLLSRDELKAGTNPLSGDSDGDGIGDKDEVGDNIEQPVDSDGDGIIDANDKDDDNDGIPTREEPAGGRLNGDDDGDGLPTSVELTLGTDPYNRDSDGDGMEDRAEVDNPAAPRDSDGDGAIDALDADDDGDGLSTRDEAEMGTDPYRKDSDGDGIEDSAEVNDPAAPRDSDTDGKIDALDPDDDNDGLSTRDELNLGTDPLSKDSDKDGVEDKVEVGRYVEKPQDTDGDGKINALDADDDDDSIPTSQELTGDFDNDGIPNYLDADDDNDGKPTRVEVQGGSAVDLDSDSDGKPDYQDNDDAVVTTSMGGGSVGWGVLLLPLVLLLRRLSLQRFSIMILVLFAGQVVAEEITLSSDGSPVVIETIDLGEPAGTPSEADEQLAADTVKTVSEAVEEVPAAAVAEAGSGEDAAPGGPGGREIDTEPGREESVVSETTGELQSGEERASAIVAEKEGSELEKKEETPELEKEEPGPRQGERFYLGLGAGATRLEPDTGTTGFSVEDRDDVGAKMMIGYEATDHISAELAGGPMGKARLTPNDREVKYNGYTLSIVYDIFGEVGGFSPLLKAGISKIDNSANIQYERDEDLLPYGGIGLKYEFDNGVALRGEYEYLAEDAQMLSLSLLKYFGGRKEPVAPVVAAPPPAPPPKVVVSFNVPDSDNDGVNDIRDGCPNTPAGAKVDDAGCAMFEGVLQGVNFETNSSRLTESAKQILDEVAEELKLYPTVRIEVQAHTDSDGPAQYNQWLSERRARSVINYLVQRGISARRLIPVGYGETKPIADNSTEEGKARNRRVEFVVLSAQ